MLCFLARLRALFEAPPSLGLAILLPVPQDAPRVKHDGDVSAACAAGLTCRPVGQTVADTRRWLQEEGYPPPGRIAHGLSPDKEQAVLAGLPR